ncbi:hypothetical protein [Rhizobium alvei]|uniref:Uncharacterized protein n=1 Tax=Rhizobium alvei TaxID=1132659 RepID=A0ABT8YTR6_9HYPH|nr:hypothetical protein [Rhizobium alvei]MDO6967098.1 hypothetical protein [Rhizobium alvei]
MDMLVQQKVLLRFECRMARHEFAERTIVVSPGFQEWVKAELNLMTAIDPAEVSPSEQVYILFKRFVLGKSMRTGRLFHRMKPLDGNHDIYELKTPDIRIFGWFYRKDFFVAAFGANIEQLKGTGMYGTYRDLAVAFRDNLPLNEPKALYGAGENDVVSV